MGRMSYEEFRRCVNDKSTGAVRAPTGLASSFADVFAFYAFARELLEA